MKLFLKGRKTVLMFLAGLAFVAAGGVAAYKIWPGRQEPVSLPVNPPLSSGEMLKFFQDRGEGRLRQAYYLPVVRAYERLLAKDPDNPELKKRLALAYYAVGDYGKARPLLEEVSQSPARDPQIEELLKKIPPAAGSPGDRGDGR